MSVNSSTATGPQAMPDPLANPLAALPNPFTPLAFLPPKVAHQLTITLYILVGAVTVQIWDTLSHLVEDYRIVRRNKIRLPMIVYFISRITTLTFIIGYTVMNTAPIGRCELVNKVFIIFEAFSIPSSQLLFLLHVRAVYMNNKRLVYFFIFLWLCSVGSSTAAPIAAYTSSPFFEIGPTKYCIGTPLRPYIGALVIVPMVNDIILFLALAWRLHKSTYVGEHEKTTFKSTVLGRHMPRISKALFQNGQAYFLTTVVFDIATVTLVYTNSVPLPFRDIMGFPGVVIMNVMAGRIYRNINASAFNPSTTPQSSFSEKKCNRQHVEEISLNPIASTASSSNGSGGARYNLKEHNEFPRFVVEQKV